MKTGLVLSYSAMNFGKHAFWSLFNLFGMLYLTEVVGLAPALAGSILLGSLLVDAVLDPAIGSLADRVRAGRKDYFEFILASALACALSITAFFGGYQGSGPWRFLLIGAGLVGFRLAFTLCDLSDNALASRITASARSRTALSAARNVARALATGMMAATVGLTMSDKIHAGHRLLLMAAATSLLATAAITIAYGRLRPFDRAAPAVSRVSLAVQWRELRKAPQAWLLCAAALLESCGTPIFLTGMAYFGSAAFRDIGWGGTAVLVFSAAQVLSQPLWVIDLQGRLVCSARQPLDEARPETIADVARRSVVQLGAESGIDTARVAGIGFAVPGDFTNYPYVLAHAFFPYLRNVDLKAVFSADMPYPTFIENDCNSAALGERIMGFGQTYSTFISVFVCHGIGGGIIIDGNLYRGKNGNAGGLHAFYPLSQPRPSGHDLFDTMAREGVQIRDFFDFEVPEALDLPGVRPWIFRAGTQLRDSLTVVSRLFDPEAIIIGGRLPPPFLAEIAAVIDTKGFCSEAETPRPKVHASELGPNAGVIGAAAVVLYARFLNANVRNPRDNLINGRRIG